MSIEARVERLRSALGIPRPEALTQDPYDGTLDQIARVRDHRAEARDWSEYLEAATYGRPFQPDLFAYVLPDLLGEWETSLDSHFAELVPLTLVRRLPVSLSEGQIPALAEYLAGAVKERFEHLDWLDCPDRAASQATYTWIEVWATASLFPGTMDLLLPVWKDLQTPGQANALLQFASCLLYRKDENPIFRPWTPELGGGPPCLWNEPGVAFGVGWHPTNTAALAAELGPEQILELLPVAAERVQVADQRLAQRIVSESGERKTLLKERWPVLLELFESPESNLSELWDA